jgi:hypothetical protein
MNTKKMTLIINAADSELVRESNRNDFFHVPHSYNSMLHNILKKRHDLTTGLHKYTCHRWYADFLPLATYKNYKLKNKLYTCVWR